MGTKSDNLSQRVEAERLAHEECDVLAESYRLKDRFSHIWTYPSLKKMNALFERYMDDVGGKMVLDYGCGNGDASLRYLENGAVVHGIDIAENYITHCEGSARGAGHPSDRWEFRVMDAHKLEFPDNHFDLVAGNGILHHLDTAVAMSEIFRVLKPGGRVILKEPLSGSPLLAVFRFLTPKARTEDEMPLSRRAMNELLADRGWSSDSYYCGLLEAPAAVFTSLVLPSSPENWILNAAHLLERRLNRFKWLESWNQYVLISLVKND